jgi:predicted Zn finger-like uncharacterized protein
VAAKEDQSVVVMCPKCKTRLKVDETRLSLGGSRFKCPKCNTQLVIKKPSAPAAAAKKALHGNKILLAHSNSEIVKSTASLLSDKGYTVITSADGIDAMVKALREEPFLALLEVALPKIYGFEVCKKIKSRAETKEMKVILLVSVYDRKKYRREPNSLYGADAYIEEHEISEQLVDRIIKLCTPEPEEKTEALTPPQPSAASQPVHTETGVETVARKPAPTEGKKPPEEIIEKARRLARTIINDIYLYNSAKADESIRNDNFYTVFASDIKEGKKLYENRIPQEVRNMSDFYREAIENFISSKKKSLM